MRDPEPDCELARDDASYPHENLSDWVRQFFDSAADHMAQWAELVERRDKPVRLHERAGYTVLRGALEAAAQACGSSHPKIPQSG